MASSEHAIIRKNALDPTQPFAALFVTDQRIDSSPNYSSIQNVGNSHQEWSQDWSPIGVGRQTGFTRLREYRMFRKLTRWLQRSPHVHIRGSGVNSVSDLIDIVDRFLDGETRYALEWDDFVSWDSSVPAIETFRRTIAQSEPMLFSKDPVQIARGVSILIEQRNKAAALIGKPLRPSSSADAAQPFVQAER